MSKKSKLLAGVAMPIFTMALTVHSALAGMPTGLRPAVDINAPALLVQVQAQAPEPETEEMLKRKRQMEEQQNKGAPEKGPGEKGPAEKGAPEGQHRPEAPRPEAPRPPAAAEPKAEPKPEPAPPKAEPRPEPKAEPAPPRAEPPPPKAEPRPEPKAEQAPPKAEPRPEPKAAPAERPPEPPKPPVPAAGNERPQPPAPKAEPRPEPKAEAPKPEAPAPRGNGAPAPAEKAAPPVAAPQTAPPAPKPPAPAEAAKPPVPPQPPEPAKGPAPAPSANEAAPKPPVPPAGANPPPPPAGAAPNGGQRPGEGGQRPGEGGANRNGAGRPAAPGQPATPGQPAPAGQAAPANQAPGSQPPPPPAPDQAGRPPAPPTAGTPQTQQDIDRAAKIARDPASAPANAQMVLPVQNGAPVLDSAKDYPPPPPPGGPGVSGRPGLPPPPPGAPQADGRRGPPPAPGQAPGRAPGQMPGQPPVAAQQPMAPPAPPPRTDADAQSFRGQQPPINVQPAISERGRRMDRAPDFALPPGFEGRGQEQDGRTIIQYNNQVFVRHDDDRRFYDEGYRPEYESLPGDRVREIIQRDDGVRIVTIRNRYGDIIQRSRVDRGGSEVVLYYAPEVQETRERDYVWRDPGLDLPPMRLTVPLDEYIVDTSADENQDYYRFLEQPPVERVERVYSIDEVRYSARIRDKMRRIDLDTITFATGSADIPMNQATTLRKVATAIEAVLKRNPAETFLIEGHTDAVGSDESNLILSDRRAESVARLLSDVYGIPAENMVTQGYGERYLKVRTDGPNQENRRVTIRRITPLVRPVAAK